jgi:AraC-like DNA-binding protein
MRVTGGIFRADGGETADTRLYGLLFAGAAGAFCLHALIGSQAGAASFLLAIIGNATCAWSWLLVRALFQRPAARRQWWPLAVVATMVAIEAVVRFGYGSASPLLRIADNAEGLASSTLLLLAAIEPLRGIGAMLPAEKRFRAGFAAGYAALLAIAVLWIDGAPASSETARFGDAVRAFCALTALIGMGFAVWYRASHPVADIAKVRRRVQADDHGLGARILHAMREEQAFARTDLKLADLASHLGEADYKVTQCITGALGFRNFNQMTNAFRLAEVKRRLADPAFDHLPILTIALDCGFGSIGPFNRAFKAELGTTPKQFRARHRPL